MGRPMEAYHTRLTWPWASQATARGRLRVPAVLATHVPRAREWADGVCKGAEGPCTQAHASAHPYHHGCVGHLLSLTAGGQDSMHVSGRGGPRHSKLFALGASNGRSGVSRTGAAGSQRKSLQALGEGSPAGGGWSGTEHVRGRGRGPRTTLPLRGGANPRFPPLGGNVVGKASRCLPGLPRSTRGSRGAMRSRLHAARPGRLSTRGGLLGAPHHLHVVV